MLAARLQVICERHLERLAKRAAFMPAAWPALAPDALPPGALEDEAGGELPEDSPTQSRLLRQLSLCNQALARILTRGGAPDPLLAPEGTSVPWGAASATSCACVCKLKNKTKRIK